MREKVTPPGADRRYHYVPFRQLDFTSQQRIRSRYPHAEEHLPDDEYLYPVKKDGSLASARRHMPGDRAKELWEAWVVKEVLDS